MLRTLVGQGVAVAMLRAVGTGLSVCVTIAIARTFGSEALGVYAYVVAWMMIAAVPVSNGWATMLLRTVGAQGVIDASARSMARTGALLAVAVSGIAGACTIGAVLLHLSPSISALRPIIFAVSPLIVATLFFDQISAMRMSLIRGIERPALSQMPEMVIRPSVLLAGLATLALWKPGKTAGDDVLGIFGALALAAFVSAAFGQSVLRRLTSEFVALQNPQRDRRRWLVSSLTLGGSAGLVQLNGYSDMLLLGALAPASDLGHYRVALQLAALASFGYVALNMVAGQRFARLHRRADRDELQKTAVSLARLGLLTALPLPLLLLAAGRPLIVFLFGPEFSDALLPCVIISLGLTFSAALGMSRTLLIMKHEEVLAMWTTAVALLINIALCIVLIPSFGITGAATANFAGACSWNLMLWYAARKKTGLDTSALGFRSKTSLTVEAE